MKDIIANPAVLGLEVIETKCNQRSNICSWPPLELPPINLWTSPMLTDKEVRDKLKKVPEIDLLEILDISSEEIVDRFDDKIEEREDYFRNDLENEEYDYE